MNPDLNSSSHTIHDDLNSSLDGENISSDSTNRDNVTDTFVENPLINEGIEYVRNEINYEKSDSPIPDNRKNQDQSIFKNIKKWILRIVMFLAVGVLAIGHTFLPRTSRSFVQNVTKAMDDLGNLYMDYKRLLTRLG